MKFSWAQPSLSRDFAFLSAAILFILLLVSGWVTYTTYEQHFDKVRHDLERESARVEKAISTEMENVDYMLSSLGRQIAISPNRELIRVAQDLKSFDNKGHVYSIFTWTNNEHKMVVSSNRGVLDEPVDISDRDFIQQASMDSWKMHIGKPIEGRVSGRWVIPVGMGITDYTGKFIGIISLSIDINKLTEQISNMVKRDGISFAIVSKSLIPISVNSDDSKFASDIIAKKLGDADLAKTPNNFISDGSLVLGTGSYAYYHTMTDYPYIIIMGYDSRSMDENVRLLLWSRLLQLLVVSAFFVFFLWIVRLRVVGPVLEMTNTVSMIAGGKKVPETIYKSAEGGSIEINALAAQIDRVRAYIEESKRIEDELRYKLLQMKTAKENSEMALRSKAEFLIYIAQEIRRPLSNMVGFSQIIKDQMYGEIGNPKYKNYAEDIFKTGNLLIAKMQDLLLHSRMETGYVSLQEKSVDIASLLASSTRQLSDKLQEKKSNIKLEVEEPSPYITADEFRLQQVITNLLLVMLESIDAEQAITLDAKLVGEQRDKQFLTIAMHLAKDSSYDSAALQDIIALHKSEKNTPKAAYVIDGNAIISEQTDVRVALSKLILFMHGGFIHTEMTEPTASSTAKICGFIMFIPASRLIFTDME